MIMNLLIEKAKPQGISLPDAASNTQCIGRIMAEEQVKYCRDNIKRKKLPSQEELKELFTLDSDTGALAWNPRRDRMGRNIGRLNSKCGHITDRGYILIGVKDKQYYAHRIIWKMLYNEEPHELDHIDGCKSNNNPNNLRVATHSQNVRNSRRRAAKTLPKGVRKHLSSGKYESRIRVDGKAIYLGLHPTAEEAHTAYCMAADKHHQNFAKHD
jgi:hypothetical protein